MEVYKKEFKDIWLKAAVIGSLWGSIEIIIGSFFHNIRFPMAGTLLAVIGISLITAFGQSWKDRGLFWRAGLICAVMKSVSPSAILIGPMTGIFMEAVLFNMAIYLFGRNYIAYILGGILALYSVVIHKVITLIIIYGFDLVRITENLYSFIVKQLKIENTSFIEAFLLLSLFYVVLGIAASVFGIFIGKKAKKTKRVNLRPISLDDTKDLISPDDSKGSLIMLFVHLFIIIGVLAITNMLSFELAFGLTLVYSILTIIKYKRALRYFKRFGFWFQIALFIFISALFYDGFNTDGLFSEEGLIAGLKMGTRAVLIVIGFSAISSELRTPFIKVFLYKRGFWQFYTALGLAFSVLPYLIKHSSRPKKILRNPIQSMIGNIHDSEFILEQFKSLKIKSKVIVITGKKHGGKTTFMKAVVEGLKSNGQSISGFLAEGTFENNKRSEFYISDIQTEKSMLICKTTGSPEQKKVGRFYFNEEGIQFGKEILTSGNNSDFIVIDEVGPFELRGKGWSQNIESFIVEGNNNMIWIVREKLVYDILRRFGITDALIFDISKNTSEDVIQELLKRKL